MTDDDRRQTILEQFSTILQLPPVSAITQRGHERKARFVITFQTDGQPLDVPLAAVDDLVDQRRLRNSLAVKGIAMIPCDTKDYAKLFASLVRWGITRTPAETQAEIVADIIHRWASSDQLTDIDAACARRAPFTRAGRLHIAATELHAKLKRAHNVQIDRTELQAALDELGFERATIHYTRPNGVESTASYYHTDPANLNGRPKQAA